MPSPNLLYFNLGLPELIILLACCGFPVIAGATGAILFFLLRQSNSKEEE